MKKILIFLLYLYCPALFGQQMQPSDIPTPTAASLGLYGDIPISYYTGRANISIPLHTLSVDGVDLPITLDYDGGGVQMNALPSWTGHNWSVNVGGVIMRKKNGEYDEWTHTGGYSFGIRNYFKFYRTASAAANNRELILSQQYQGVIKDLEPDEFIFNFMGIQGRFFLGNDGQWKVFCDEDIDVIFDIEDTSNYTYPFTSHFPPPFHGISQSPSIKGFTLRNSSGISFYFGGLDATEYTIPFFTVWENERSLTSWMPTCWYLRHVKDKYGNLLYNFNYENGYYTAQFYNSYEDGYAYIITHGNNIPVNSKSANRSFPWDGTLSTSVYLKEILSGNTVLVTFDTEDFPVSTKDLYSSLPGTGRREELFGYWNNNTVEDNNAFYYLSAEDGAAAQYQYAPNRSYLDKRWNPLESTRLKYLKSISIQTMEDSFDDERYSFDFDYDFSPRMHLTNLSVRRKVVDETVSESGRYTFEYDSFHLLPEDYLTTAADHWGYYRYFGYNIRNLNPPTIRSLRNPDNRYSQYGILKKIVYPTGGFSLFEYEQNDFSRCVSANRQTMRDSTSIAGGLRIKSISEYDYSNELLKRRTFSYTDPQTGTSSGELFAAPCYYWRNWAVPASNEATVTYTSSFIRMSSIIPLSNSFGPHVGYSCVTETFADGSHIRYRYKNISSAMDERYVGMSDAPLSPYEKFSSKGFMRGKPIFQEFFDKNGVKVRSLSFRYREDSGLYEQQFVYGADICSFGFKPLGVFTQMFVFPTGGAYKLYYPKYDLLETSDTLFLANSHITTTHRYERKDSTLTLSAPYEHQTDIRILQSETVTRGQHSQRSVLLYPFRSSGNTERQYLCSKEFDIRPTGELVYLDGKKTVSEQTWYKLIEKRNQYYSAPDFRLRTSYPDSLTDGATECTDTLVKYHTYTADGRLETFQKLGEPVTSLLWNPMNLSLVAIGVGGTWISQPNIDRRFFETDYANQVLDNLRASHPHMQVTTYTSHPLPGVTSITQPSGQRTYYDYDGFLRLIGISDHNRKPIKQYEYHYRK